MRKEFLALILSGTLGLSLLAGCVRQESGPIGTPVPGVSATPSSTMTAEPKPSTMPEPSVGPTPDVTDTPEPSGDPGPAPSTQPGQPPTRPPAPRPDEGNGSAGQVKPTDTPSPTPSPSESTQPTVSAVKSIWNQVALQGRPALIDMDAALLSDLYGIDSTDLVEFVAKMPAMSASVSEFLIAKCAPGRVDAVKQFCLDRQAALVADDRYPDTVKLAERYQLVTSGDYLLFAVDEHAEGMAEIFHTYTK